MGFPLSRWACSRGRAEYGPRSHAECICKSTTMFQDPDGNSTLANSCFFPCLSFPRIDGGDEKRRRDRDATTLPSPPSSKLATSLFPIAMASSSITPLSLSLPFSPTPILLFPSSVASLGVATRLQGKKPGALAAAAKAMGGGGGGGGKYKGTQMRERRLREMIEEKVAEAKQACEGEAAASAECRVAWAEVEEVSQAKAHLRLKLEVLHQDPLESFCGDNPETDECHVYDADDDDE
ncbi:hypothetical protein NL676_027531 [Syzygium grande]|nr:hypothetical protein NL676_027531 [Syzygium grande]